MNIIEAMTALQEFRAGLAEWGVTNEILILIGVAAFILWLLSAREVFGWFIKTHTLREEIRDLRREVIALKELIQERHEITEKPDTNLKDKLSATKSESRANAEDERPASRFRLDH